jgi:Leucine-rich repeat (LRR) protein
MITNTFDTKTYYCDREWMKNVFRILSLFAFSLPTFASSEWLYYKHFPWVYDYQSKNWMYLHGSTDGKIYVFFNSTDTWSEFAPDNLVRSWGEKYEKWVKNPEPYGGLSVLEEIKKAEESGSTKLELRGKNISDISPLAGLDKLERLYLWENKITDISPLAELSNLTELNLNSNNISDISPLSNLNKLQKLYLYDNEVNLVTLQNLKNLTNLSLARNKLSELSPLKELKNLEELNLEENNISDVSPLSQLKNLVWLSLSNNNISDTTPLIELSNLTTLQVLWNSISTEQIYQLRESLPNASIGWPDP